MSSGVAGAPPYQWAQHSLILPCQPGGDYSTTSIEEGKNELRQLTNCFLTRLPLVGRNWKSSLGKEEQCNLDYADWSTQTHKRAVLLLPIPLFFFPVTLPRYQSNTLFSISEKKGGVHNTDRRKCVQLKKKNPYTTNKRRGKKSGPQILERRTKSARV